VLHDPARILHDRVLLSGSAPVHRAEDLREIRDRPHFDRTVLRCGALRSPLDGFVETRQLEQDEAAELLFRIGERPILYVALTTSHANRGRSRVRRIESPMRPQPQRMQGTWSPSFRGSY
jgi:hypothetical protein